MLLASRADSAQADESTLILPPRATVRGSVKAALSDFYFNSIRLVAANIVWGIGLLATLILLATTSPLLALPAAIALALPTAGIFGLAAVIARDEPASMGDAFAAWRTHGPKALAIGAFLVPAVGVLGFNFVIGLLADRPLWWMIGTLAAWGLLALLLGAASFWPLLMDPVRDGVPLKQRLGLAIAVIFYAPMRYLGLMLICGAILIVSTIAFAALLTISLAFVALLLCRYVLPTADRLEGRATYAEPILD